MYNSEVRQLRQIPQQMEEALSEIEDIDGLICGADYLLVSDIIVACMIKNPDDPLDSARELLYQAFPRREHTLNNKMNYVASIFFRRLGREDLLNKYSLG